MSTATTADFETHRVALMDELQSRRAMRANKIRGGRCISFVELIIRLRSRWFVTHNGIYYGILI